MLCGGFFKHAYQNALQKSFFLVPVTKHYKNIPFLYTIVFVCAFILHVLHEDNFECFDFLGGGKFKPTENEQQPANQVNHTYMHDSTFIYLKKV